MQKNKAFLLLFAGLFFWNCSSSTSPNRPWSEDNTVVCFGTSLTAVYREDYKSYPDFLKKKLKIDVVNKGHVGATSYYAVDHIDDVLAENPYLVILEFGANDFFKEYSPSILANNLAEVIRKLMEFGCDIALVNFAHPDMAENILQNAKINELLKYFPADYINEMMNLGLKYHTTIDSIAEVYNLPYEDYMLEIVDADSSMIGSDCVHPNLKGNRQVAKNILSALDVYFEENKMYD